jgi:competence protein ComEA
MTTLSTTTPVKDTSRAAQFALAALCVLLLGALGFRGYAPRFGARPTEYHPATVARQINLNTADRAELLQVPGIGPGLADGILAYRQDRGRFDAVDDLAQVHGIGDKTLEKVRPWLAVVETPEPRTEVVRLERKPAAKPAAPFPARSSKLQPGDPPIDVNTAPLAELQRLPGVGPTLAQRILAGREQTPFKSVEELRRIKGIGLKTLERIRPFVKVTPS